MEDYGLLQTVCMQPVQWSLLTKADIFQRNESKWVELVITFRDVYQRIRYVHSLEEKFLFNYWTDFPYYLPTYFMQVMKLLLRDTLYITRFRSVASRVLLESEGLCFNIIYINTFMIQSFKTEAKLFNCQDCSS